MLFNSLSFLIFFPLVTVLYFLFPRRYRWTLLLLASSVFYMVFVPKYIFILLVLIAIDYSAGIYIETREDSRKKVALIISIVSTCAALFLFKYFNFFNTNVVSIAKLLHWNYSLGALKLALPIGLSFHTFQSLSYVIEVYRGRQKAERHLGIYALYVMFYPQLVAGPIERPQNLLHQFREEHFFRYDDVVYGLKKMLQGFLKKILIADRLALFVAPVFANPSRYSGMSLVAAVLYFTFQIYCDFSGYSDIAVGAARVMGFRLMENFNHPYNATSISDFWRRWHISLSSWFRDYVYIPLGGSRVSGGRRYFNILAVFLLSGLWHGANWTFVVWGAVHGIYLIFSQATGAARTWLVRVIRLAQFPRLHYFLKMGTTFFFAAFAWIFFRANTLRDAWYIVGHLLTGWKEYLYSVFSLHFSMSRILSPFFPSQDKVPFAVGILLAAGFMAIMRFMDFEPRGSSNDVSRFGLYPGWLRWGTYYVLIFAILYFGVFQKAPFIYFQF